MGWFSGYAPEQAAEPGVKSLGWRVNFMVARATGKDIILSSSFGDHGKKAVDIYTVYSFPVFGSALFRQGASQQ